MDSTQKQIDTLKGETLALQMILGQLTQGLANSSPDTLAVVRLAFDEAANYAEQIALAFGEAASPEHTAAALGIVEKMRAVALKDHQRPPSGA